MKTFSEGIQNTDINGIPGVQWETERGGIISFKDNFPEGVDKDIILDYYLKSAGILSNEHKKFIKQRVEGWEGKTIKNFLDFIQAADREYILQEGIKPKITTDEEKVLILFYNAAGIISTKRKKFIEKQIQKEWSSKKPSTKDEIRQKTAFLTFIQNADRKYRGLIPEEVQQAFLSITDTQKKEMEKEIEMLISDKIPKLTKAEKKRIWKTKGLVPAWWPEKPEARTVIYYMKKGIESLKVSAADIERILRQASRGELKESEAELTNRRNVIKEDLIKNLGLEDLTRTQQLLRIKESLFKKTEGIEKIRDAQRIIRLAWPVNEAKKIIAGRSGMPSEKYLKKYEEGLKTFSEGINNFQDIELTMGDPEWQKLLREMKEWRKTGGTLKAVVKGKDESKNKSKRPTDYTDYNKKVEKELDNYLVEEPIDLDPDTPQEFLQDLEHERHEWIQNGLIEDFDQDGELLAQGIDSNAFQAGLFEFIRNADDYWHDVVQEEVDDILDSLDRESEKINTYARKTITSSTAKSTATKILKYFVTKEGLKISAKTAAKAITKLSGTLMSPWLIPLIWSPEIIDIVTSKDVQKIWKNMKDENWWKEAIERDKKVREEALAGKMPKSFSTAPYGENYHRDIGWY
jgi:hypothetical protein